MDAPNPYVGIYASMAVSLQEASAHQREWAARSRLQRTAYVASTAPALLPSEFNANCRVSDPSTLHTNQISAQLERRCTVCESRSVIVRCHSCARFEPSGLGYYCMRCFGARHPAHRAEHYYVPTGYGDELEIEMHKREACAAQAKFVKDLRNVVTTLTPARDALRLMDNDDRAADLVMAAHHRSHELEGQLVRLQRALHPPALQRVSKGQTIREPTDFSSLPTLAFQAAEKGRPSIFSFAIWDFPPEQAAARLLQRLWRRFSARTRLSQIVAERFQKILDAESGYYYFVDLRTMETSWEPPRVLWRLLCDASCSESSKTLGINKKAAVARAAKHILTPRAYELKFGHINYDQPV